MSRGSISSTDIYMLMVMEPILLYWAVYMKLFPVVASDWLYYTAITIHLLKCIWLFSDVSMFSI